MNYIRMKIADIAYDIFLRASGVTNSEFKNSIIEGWKNRKLKIK